MREYRLPRKPVFIIMAVEGHRFEVAPTGLNDSKNLLLLVDCLTFSRGDPVC